VTTTEVLDNPDLLDTEFVDWLEESDHLTPEQKKTFAPVIDAAKRLSLQPKQSLAQKLSQEADELLYGGAAGGGKSEWLIRHCAREMLKYPGNRGVIFRRVFPSLNRTIIPRAIALLKPWATYNKNEHTFTFTNGSVLELASLQYENSVLDYTGAEYGVIAFEEVTEFLESQVDFMKSRLRAPVEGPRPHLVATTNPGGVGHAWVKRRWVRPKPEDYVGDTPPEPFEVWTPAPTDSDPEPLKRCFVPATLKDNPKLCQRDPAYIRKIRAMRNRGLRRALEHGDWDAVEKVEGAQWAGNQLDFCRVRTAPPPEQLSMVAVGIDPSGGKKRTNDEQGIVAVGKGYDGHGYVLADRSCKKSVHGWSRQAVQLAIDVDADVIVVEVNFGGEMAEDPLKRAAADLGWHGRVVVRNASRGKRIRAEPVADLYGSPDDPETWDTAVMHHVGDLEQLEDEMKTWLPTSGDSPNRMDAFVWAATEVMVGVEEDYDIPDHTQGGSLTADLLEREW